MKLINILIGSLIFVSVVCLVVVLTVKQNIVVQPTPVQVNSPEQVLGSALDYTRRATNVTSTSVSVSTTTATVGNTLVLAAESSVAYRRIQNVGTTGVTCQLSSATGTLVYGTGIVLASSSASINSSYEITLTSASSCRVCKH